MPLSSGNALLASLQPQAREFFQSRAELREMKVGDLIYDDGDAVTHAIFPHEGVISLIGAMESGHSVEKSSIGKEGFVGFSLIMGGGRAMGRSVVQIAGSASWVTMEDLDVALQRFVCVQEFMLRFARSHIVQLMETVACNSLHSAEQRVVRWLMHAHDRVAGDEFYVTQEAISLLLAMRRATVNSVCSDLANAGAIAYHRGSILIADRSLLEQRVCGCYGRIRLAFSRGA